MPEFEKARFNIDAIPDTVFEGYSDGDTWNGFACPYFEKDVAEHVLRASVRNGYSWTYDADRDAFIVRSIQDPPDYEPEEFLGQSIMVNGQKITVYGIGAYFWIWGMVE
jgi:hypothetical protein